ncbi:hypothetical protein M0R01_04560 [bacterium]|nr:hypothetical protein [bacterium]
MKKLKKELIFCEHCGALMKSWWHRLTPGLVDLLFRAIDLVKKNQENIIKKNEICFTVSENCNFNKLRYFGLIAKHRDIDDCPIEGEFVLTINAGRFLRGEIEMPVRVKTYRNELKEKDIKTVSVSHFYNLVPEFDKRSQFEFEIHEGNLFIHKQNKLI